MVVTRCSAPDRPGPGPLPVPRAGRDQPGACSPRSPRRSWSWAPRCCRCSSARRRPRLRDDHHRAHHVLDLVRGGHGAGPGAHAGPVDRGGGRATSGRPWTTFWLVTFPMILPGVLSGALLAFALSIDDFVITNFTGGTTVDVPAVDLGRHPGRDAAAGQRHGHADLRGRRADRGGQHGDFAPPHLAALSPVPPTGGAGLRCIQILGREQGGEIGLRRGEPARDPQGHAIHIKTT